MEYIFLISFLALTLCYFVFALKKFEQAVMWLPLFFPAYLIRLQLGSVPFTLVEFFIYAAGLAWLVRFAAKLIKTGFHEFFSKNIKWKEGVRCGCRIMLPVLLFVAAAVMGVIVTKERILMLDGNTIFYGQKVALGIFKGWIIAPILMFVLFHAAIKKPEQILKMLNFYTVSAVLLSVWGLYQVITGSYDTPDARASGPFESANYLALYIAPAILYLAIRIRDSFFPLAGQAKSGFLKIFFRREDTSMQRSLNLIFILAFLLLVMALLFTKSYAAMLAVFAAGTFYFGLEFIQTHKGAKVKRFPWKIVALVAVFMIAVIVLIFLMDPSKLEALFQFQSRNSSSVRVQVYTIALSLIRKYWFTGIGLGQFPAFYQLEAVRILGHAPYEWNMLHPHNLYLTMWLYTGLPGMIAFVWFLFVMLCNCCSSLKTFALKKINEMPKIRVMGLALLFIILIHGCLDTPYFKNDLALIFWMIAAVILFPVEEETKS